MATPIRPLTISQLGAFTDLLPAAVTDYWAIRPSKCSGLGGPPQRTTVEDAPGLDGALIFPPFDGAWIITLGGELNVTSTGLSRETGYDAAVDALLADLVAAIDAAKTAPIDLVHSGGTLKVWKYGEIDVSWEDDLEAICSVTCSFVVDVFA